MMGLNIQDLWVKNHPDMKAAEAALTEATKWDPDPAAYNDRVSKAEESVSQVRSRLLVEFHRATTSDRPVIVPSHVAAAAKLHR